MGGAASSRGGLTSAVGDPNGADILSSVHPSALSNLTTLAGRRAVTTRSRSPGGEGIAYRSDERRHRRDAQSRLEHRSLIGERHTPANLHRRLVLLVHSIDEQDIAVGKWV